MSKIRKFLPSAEHAVADLLKGWNLETPGMLEPSTKGSGSLVISGWAIGFLSITEVLIRTALGSFRSGLSVDRPDVVEALLKEDPNSTNHSLCGFYFDTSIPLESIISFDLGFTIQEKDIWIGTVLLEDASKVLIGKEGWLFLDNDSNGSVDQFLGKIKIPSCQQTQWEQHFTSLEDLARAEHFEWRMALAPAKEYILEEYYPHPLSKENTPAQFMTCFQDNGKILYPLKTLKKYKELAYWKGDTHWTDYGACIAARIIIEAFKLDPSESLNDSNLQFTIRNVIGDLSEKLYLPVSYPKIELSDRVENLIPVYDNQIINNGRVLVYLNSQAPCRKKVLVFGSSSSYSIVKFLSMHFERVVLVHSTAAVDIETLKHEKPDYLLLQSNSRFINIAPEPLEHYSLKATINSKLDEMSRLELSTLEALHSKYKNHQEQFYSSMMEIIIVKKTNLN